MTEDIIPEDGAVEEELRPGFFRDKEGQWKPDRRASDDRRGRPGSFPHHDRRLHYRRKTDREIMEREARTQIEEALEDFAAEHDT
jgi:hypothetical protein